MVNYKFQFFGGEIVFSGSTHTLEMKSHILVDFSLLSVHLLSVIWKDDHWSLITPNLHLSAYSDYQVPNHSADSSLLPQHLLQVNLINFVCVDR